MPTPQLVFSVAWNPATQGSKRHVGKGRMIESDKGLPDWRSEVVHQARSAATEQGWPMTTEEAIFCGMTFSFVRPKSVRRPFHTVKPDFDKLLRAVADALTISRVIDDDKQICEGYWLKRYTVGDEPPGVRIKLGIVATQSDFELAG